MLTLSSNVEYTKYVSPVCLWENMSNNVDDIVNEDGTVRHLTIIVFFIIDKTDKLF